MLLLLLLIEEFSSPCVSHCLILQSLRDNLAVVPMRYQTHDDRNPLINSIKNYLCGIRIRKSTGEDKKFQSSISFISRDVDNDFDSGSAMIDEVIHMKAVIIKYLIQFMQRHHSVFIGIKHIRTKLHSIILSFCAHSRGSQK